MHESHSVAWSAPSQRDRSSSTGRGTERYSRTLAGIDVLAEELPKIQRDIQARLYELEPATRIDANEIHAEALEIQRLANDLNFELEATRADLLIADIIYRRGEIILAGRTVQAIQDWAISQRHDYILARTHRIIAGHYFRTGDENRGIAAAVECVRQLPRKAPQPVHIDHIMCVGDCLANSGSLDPAAEEYAKALSLARRLGDPQWTLVALNNQLATFTEQENYEGAQELVDEMLSVHDTEKLKLDYCYRDTLAQLDMAKGNYDGVMALLGPLLDPDHDGHRADPFGYVDCMLTFIEAAQEREDYERSKRALGLVRQLEVDRGVQFSPKPILVLEAKQAAAEGDFEEAYALQCAAFEASERSRADERDTQSRLLHSVHVSHEAQAVSQRFQRLALQDPLTGLGNRRFVFETLPQRISHRTHFAVGIVDLDHFKNVNDTYSHAAGDIVLKEFAVLMVNALKMPVSATESGQWSHEDIDVMTAYESHSANYAARLGGEEFVIVFAVQDLAGARAAAEHLLGQFRGHHFPGGHGLPSVTASIGLVVPTPGETVDEVLTRADKLLYEAKAAGRDQVAI